MTLHYLSFYLFDYKGFNIHLGLMYSGVECINLLLSSILMLRIAEICTFLSYVKDEKRLQNIWLYLRALWGKMSDRYSQSWWQSFI